MRAALWFLAMTVVGWEMADQPPPQLAPQPETTAKAANRPTRHVRKSGPPGCSKRRCAIKNLTREGSAFPSPDKFDVVQFLCTPRQCAQC